jgi:hypothetical protein
MSEERDTQREIAQDKINADIMRSLGRLEAKMDDSTKSFDRFFAVLQNHEARIAKSENSLVGIKVKLGIAGAFIGAIFSALGQWIWTKLFNHSA